MRIPIWVRLLYPLYLELRVSSVLELIPRGHPTGVLFPSTPQEAKLLCSRLADHLPLNGTFRRSSSKKFSRKTTWFWSFCGLAVSSGMIAATRLPSGATS